MIRAFQLVGAALLFLSAGLCADQKNPKPAPPPKAPPPAKNFNNKAPNNAGGVPKNVPRINNPGPAQRLLQMTPEERERALEKLPAPQQAKLRETLEKLDKLPQAQKDQIAMQTRIMDNLPAAKRRLVTQQVMAFNNLPPDRHVAMRRTLMQLMRMPEDERNAQLESEPFKKQFSPEEQGILRDLSSNLPAEYFRGGR